MNGHTARRSVPWLVSPATNDVEWFALPTGLTFCEVTVVREARTPSGPGSGNSPFAIPTTDAELRSRPSKAGKVTFHVSPNQPMSSTNSMSASVKLADSLIAPLMDVLRDVRSALRGLKLRVELDGIDPWLVSHRPDLFERPSFRIAILAVCLDAIRAFTAKTDGHPTDDNVAQSAAESVVGGARAPFFKHWARAALADQLTLAATYPGEGCLTVDPPTSPYSILVLSESSISNGASDAVLNTASINESKAGAKAQTIRLVRASRTDASLLAGDVATISAAFHDAPHVPAVMRGSVAAYPLRSAIAQLQPTSIPGIFLLPACRELSRAKRDQRIEHVLRAHAVEYRVFENDG